MNGGAIDRLDIIELLARYHHAVDAKDWPTLRALFIAEDLLVRSDIAVSENLVALYKALGGGWEEFQETPR